MVCKMENVRRFQFRYVPSWVRGERYLKVATFIKQTQDMVFLSSRPCFLLRRMHIVR